MGQNSHNRIERIKLGMLIGGLAIFAFAMFAIFVWPKGVSHRTPVDPVQAQKDKIQKMRDSPMEPELLAMVGEFQWVVVLNAEPVASLNTSFTFGNTCSIDIGGQLSRIGKDGEDYLVSYRTYESAAGAICPSGVVFLIPIKDFDASTAEYDRVRKEERETRQLVADLVSLSPVIGHLAKMEVKGLRWIKVMNTNGIASANNLFKFGDDCSINEDGALSIIGSTTTSTLMIFITNHGRGGSQCPNGTMFFLDGGQF